MNSLCLSSSPLPSTLPLHRRSSFHHLQPHYSSTCCYSHFSFSQCLSYSVSCKSARNRLQPINVVTPSNEGATSVVNFEDFMEKDWSFLEADNTSNEANKMKASRVISAGEIEKTSKVLVSIGSEGFVDQMVESSPCQQLVVIHDSLLTLACIKEKYDNVNCWQGELLYLPEKWLSFDAMFLYFLPALPFELDEIFGSLAKRCLTGTRLIISHLEGREVLEYQRQQHPDVIVSNLPDKLTLENDASDHSFKMIEFVDEPGFYLAVLKFEAKS